MQRVLIVQVKTVNQRLILGRFDSAHLSEVQFFKESSEGANRVVVTGDRNVSWVLFKPVSKLSRKDWTRFSTISKLSPSGGAVLYPQ